MIITSAQQIEDFTNPGNAFDTTEFEDIALKFGSFVCIARGKKLNFLNFLKLFLEDQKTQKIFMELLEDTNLHAIIKAYINCAPNLYKRLFRSKLNRKNRNLKTNKPLLEPANPN
ncbi:MAG: hypothetical protein WCP38_03210 [Chloroflexota bacterium]|jgi:hypothetical protein